MTFSWVLQNTAHVSVGKKPPKNTHTQTHTQETIRKLITAPLWGRAEVSKAHRAKLLCSVFAWHICQMEITLMQIWPWLQNKFERICADIHHVFEFGLIPLCSWGSAACRRPSSNRMPSPRLPQWLLIKPKSCGLHSQPAVHGWATFFFVKRSVWWPQVSLQLEINCFKVKRG